MPRTIARISIVSALFASLVALSACSDDAGDDAGTKHSKVTPGSNGGAYPISEEDRRKERVGKLTGEEGVTIGGATERNNEEGGKNPLGVNSFIWRATLDTLAFMPLASADPFGGVILTDWYEDPDAPGERFKINALIMDRQLRADSLKISVFRQKKDKVGTWSDAPVDAAMGRKLENTVLTRARQLRINQLGK